MKILLTLSLVSNAILLLLYVLMVESNSLNYAEAQRIDQVRMEDTKILESLLVDRISKEETLGIFRKNLKDSEYFEKPSENGIGAGSMFLRFDDNAMLTEIEVHGFEGP